MIRHVRYTGPNFLEDDMNPGRITRLNHLLIARAKRELSNKEYKELTTLLLALLSKKNVAPPPLMVTVPCPADDVDEFGPAGGSARAMQKL